ncbi:MAG: FeoB-associated Cys-rich membrane protein [Emergencia sp.]
MIDVTIGLLIAALVGAAITYIIKAKKKGVKCIGCPNAGTCCSGKPQDNRKGAGCSCASENK